MIGWSEIVTELSFGRSVAANLGWNKDLGWASELINRSKIRNPLVALLERGDAIVRSSGHPIVHVSDELGRETPH